MVGVSASVIFPSTIKVQKKFSSVTGSPGWSWKKGHKTVVCVCDIDTVIVVPVVSIVITGYTPVCRLLMRAF